MRSSSHETHGQPAPHADAGLETAPFRLPWICGLLRFAGICHIAGGAVALFAAPSILRVFGVASPNPELLRYIGALIAALGLGYVLAASNPAQHWPIVLGGLAANIAAPVCLFQGASAGQISWLLCWTLVANHLAWLVLFAVTLHGAYRYHLGTRHLTSPEIQEFALRLRTNRGNSLLDLSRRQPLLLVFLRHAGCTFCREALVDIAAQRKQIESTNVEIVLIHMGSEAHGAKFLKKYGLDDLARVSDERRALYRAFGLRRGNILQILGPRVLWRGLIGGALQRHRAGRLAGDGLQMPGIFLIYHGHVVRSFIHQSIADRPDYRSFVSLSNVAESGALG